jgi:hypothetical protein
MFAADIKTCAIGPGLSKNTALFLEMYLFDIYLLDTNSTLTNIRRQFISGCA